MGWGEPQQASERAARAALLRIAPEILELAAEHQPQWASPEVRAKGKEPIGCTICYPGDGYWPCFSRMCVDSVLRHLEKLGLIDV